MTTKVVTDDTLGILGRRYHELFDRVRKGVLDSQAVLDGMQALIEGSFSRGTVVDLDADPFVPGGWTVEEHKKGESLDLATAMLGLSKQDGERIVGHDLRKELANEAVLSANVLDFLLKSENQRLIPDDWKGKYVCFWGTVYRDAAGCLYVRCLWWSGDRWRGAFRWLDGDWVSGLPAAVVARPA